MTWIPIEQTYWEYSTTPEIDDPDNAHNYVGKHTNGVRVNSDGTQNYVYCQKVIPPGSAVGWVELNKTYYDNLNSGIDDPQYNWSYGENTYYLGMI